MWDVAGETGFRVKLQGQLQPRIKIVLMGMHRVLIYSPRASYAV